MKTKSSLATVAALLLASDVEAVKTGLKSNADVYAVAEAEQQVRSLIAANLMQEASIEEQSQAHAHSGVSVQNSVKF